MIDAQIFAASHAVGVLSRVEAIDHARRQGEAVPSAGLVTHVSAKPGPSSAPLGDADQVAGGVRATATQPPSKPVCGSVCEFCGGESAFDLTFCAHCGDALDVRAMEREGGA